MRLTRDTALCYVPDGMPEAEALARITHLGIGAHQDDLEFMAFHGILAGYHMEGKWFGGVTCTDGAGSARSGPFASCTDEEMCLIRKKEQNTAAEIGGYGAMIQLDHPSRDIKGRGYAGLTSDLTDILTATRPDVVYTHNPADKHDTHVAVVVTTLQAVRALPPEQRPRQVLGCEVWRGLDWMMDKEKIALEVGGNDDLATTLNSVFASQISGGKRYDLATMGRRRANATFLDSHCVDGMEQCWYAMDLSPLVRDDALDIVDYVEGHISRFAHDVRVRLTRQQGADPLAAP